MADALAKQKGIKLDRGSKCLKDVLICWFCANCSEINCGVIQPGKAPAMADASWMDQMEPLSVDIARPDDAVWQMTHDDVAHSGPCIYKPELTNEIRRSTINVPSPPQKAALTLSNSQHFTFRQSNTDETKESPAQWELKLENMPTTLNQ
jgi:hypothetical protein